MVNTNEKEENIKSADESRGPKTDVIDVWRENSLKLINEVTKNQPTYIQSISNVQMEFLESFKNMINTVANFQKQFAYYPDNVEPFETMAKQYSKQANDFTNSVMEFQNINNKIVFNLLNVAAETIKNSSKNVYSINKFNTTAFEQWSAFYKNMQQFFKKP